MSFIQMTIGEAKKQFAHYWVDCITYKNSAENVFLHDFVEFLSAVENCYEINNSIRNW